MIYLFSGNSDLAVKVAREFYDRISQRNFAPEAQFEFDIRMGWVYRNAYQNEDAIRYFRKAESLARESSLVPPANIAMNATHLISCYRMTGQYDSALYYAYFVQDLYKEHDLRVLDLYMNDLVECFLAMDKLDSAAFYSQKALDTHTESGFEESIAYTLIQKGKVAGKLKDWAGARTYYEKAIEHARWVVENKSYYKDKQRHVDYWYSPMQDVSDNLERRGFRLLMDAHDSAYKICKILGDFAGSTYHMEQYIEAWKHIEKLEKNKEVLELNTRYETERKQQRILMLEKETELAQSNIRQTRLFLFGISGFLVVILFMVLLYLRQNRLKEEQDKIVLQQRLFRSQMNPHFLYNSLASIQNFIVTEDPDNASIYLSRFSSLVRSILDSSNEEFVALDKEIRLIDNYLALQKVRFPDKFDYIIDIDPDLDTENVMIPPMLAQPFIENAIEHGIKHKKDKGRIEVRIRRSFEQLNNRTIEQLNSRTVEQTIFEIEDDGIGRKAAGELLLKQDPDHRSMATMISRQRISAINKKSKQKITMDIIDLKDDQGEALGTKVVFVIPFDL
jgi:hypothetical protein